VYRAGVPSEVGSQMPRTPPTEGSSRRGDNLLAGRALASSEISRGARQNVSAVMAGQGYISSKMMSFRFYRASDKRLVYGELWKHEESKGDVAMNFYEIPAHTFAKGGWRRPTSRSIQSVRGRLAFTGLESQG
jgi:hypothetical protein